MGIYLPNVDMPKGDKVVTIQICPDGSIWQQYRGTVPNAKAVPVPAHRRLGDLDALEELISNDPSCITVFDAIKKIQGMPTIIPASGGAEDE